MSKLSEKQKITNIIKDYKKRYPAAVKNKKDDNLKGEFLEQLTREASTYIGLDPYAHAMGAGDRGIDVKLVATCFKSPLPFALECMNDKNDIGETTTSFFRLFSYLSPHLPKAHGYVD